MHSVMKILNRRSSAQAFVGLTLILSLVSAPTARAEDPVPTQTQVAKDGAWKYFKNLPRHGWDNFLALIGMDDYQLLRHEHMNRPESSAFRMFKANSVRRQGGLEHTYPFANSKAEFKNLLKVEFGLCAGFTVSLRKFQMLAYFDKNNTERQSVPNATTNPDAWFEFMKEKIDDVMDRKMVVIPGFANIREFSSHPKIAEYIKKQIIHQWQLTNVNVLQGVFQGMGGTQRRITFDQSKKLHADLSERLKMGFNPIVYLAKKSDTLFSTTQWIHVLQVTGVSPMTSDGNFQVRVLDINHVEPAMANRTVYFKSGKPFYEAYDGQAAEEGVDATELSNVIPLKWDDLEITDMVKQNLEFCIDRPGFCTQPRN